MNNDKELKKTQIEVINKEYALKEQVINREYALKEHRVKMEDYNQVRTMITTLRQELKKSDDVEQCADIEIELECLMRKKRNLVPFCFNIKLNY